MGGALIITTPNEENLEDNMVYCPVSNTIFHRWQHDLILRLLDRYPANHIAIEMTVMRQSGVSATNLDVTMLEFGRVLRKHNVPSILVGLLTGARRAWWKLRSK